MATSNTITLKVKCPPGTLEGGIDDIALGEVPVSTPIGAIRLRLQSVISFHPRPDQQRLLYGGRVLFEDAQTLAEALNTKRDPTQRDYVIHLIVRRGQSDTPSPRPQPRSQEQHPHPPTNTNAQTQGTWSGHAPAGNVNIPHGLPFPYLPSGIGLPEQARAAFEQAIAQGQQQRAAMGMQGVGSTPDMTQTHNAQAPNHAQSSPTQTPPTQSDGQPPAPEAVSSQAFHIHGTGPNGQQFQVHHQTFNFPHTIMPNIPNVPQAVHFPQIGHLNHMLHQQNMQHVHGSRPFPMVPRPPPAGVPALDQARENMASIQQELRSLAEAATLTDEQRTQLANIQERTSALSNYIDPFGLANQRIPDRNHTPSLNHSHGSSNPTARADPCVRTQPFTPAAPSHNASHLPQTNRDIVCYLLSSPHGPQALLVSPQHGRYTTSNVSKNRPPETVMQTPMGGAGPSSAGMTAATAPDSNDAQNGQLVPVAEVVPEAVQQQLRELQQAQAQAQAQAPGLDDNPFGAAQPLLGHFWLLFRILVFAYFVLGSDFGWQRPLALGAIGLGFWLMRLGLFVEGGVVRRWWDDLIRVPNANRPAADAPGAVAGQPAVANAAMPTPAQLAERLLAQRNQLQQQRWQQLREWLRPVERAVALFLASLWPGIGEAHVEATEREERRRLAEEVEARRRGEEERNAAGAEDRAEKKAKPDGTLEEEAEPAEKAEASSAAPPVAVADAHTRT